MKTSIFRLQKFRKQIDKAFGKDDESQNKFEILITNISDLNKKVSEGTADLEFVTQSLQESENLLSEIEDKYAKLEKDIFSGRVNLKRELVQQDKQIMILGENLDQVEYKLDYYGKKIESVINHLQPDVKQSYAIDTMRIATALDGILALSQISVKVTPVIKTDLAFLYSSIVENSLINNKESRLLTTIPITSRRGYNYFQFSQPIYRTISVRQFMDISFQLLDKKGNFFKFNLYGDDVTEVNREYPTILNLHIRQAIKG
jgi:DNA repair ATPase RecN